MLRILFTTNGLIVLCYGGYNYVQADLYFSITESWLINLKQFIEHVK